MSTAKTTGNEVVNSQPSLELNSRIPDQNGRRALPPLNALRAFEAAARHRSFSSAARELNVTISAISHQVRSLEVWLEKQLFKRNSRPLCLTETGISYFLSVGESFGRLLDATSQLRDLPARELLTICTTHSFASSWLMPRLERFRSSNKWLDVQVRTQSRYLDLRGSDCDVAIRYGSGRWVGTHAELLLIDRRIPVCSPRLLGLSSLSGFRIEQHTLIHDGSRPSWSEWFERHGTPDKDVSSERMFFTHTYLAAQAAARGYGVALVSEPLVIDALGSGDLASPSPLSLQGSGAYYLVTPEGSEINNKTRIFSHWLKMEVSLPSP